MTKYLGLEEVLFIHYDLIEKYGGINGVRDLGLIQSALARPKSGFGTFEAYPDLLLKVAVLGHSLVKNHAFIDGNKRTAVTAMEMFLWKNDLGIIAVKDEIYQLALNIANNEIIETDIAKWLKEHTRKL